MTATTATTAPTAPAPVAQAHKSKLGWAVSDTLAIAGRNLRAMQRVPEVIVFSTIQPVLFVLMFRYAFGGAINVPGVRYVDYLMPGIFAQTVAFGSINTGIGLAEDLHKGLIERFRSLPMARSAVLAGRTVADLVRDVVVIALMVIVGFLVGFRVHTNIGAFAIAILLLLMFAFALAWVFAFIGLSVPNSEAAQAASFPPLALLTFASSAFVPLKTQPGWLQAFSAHQPLTINVNAVRALVLGGPTMTPVLQSIAWSVAIVAVFAPIAVARYRRAA
jgi:ABC transporter DrrB family efflux protein